MTVDPVIDITCIQLATISWRTWGLDGLLAGSDDRVMLGIARD